MHASDILRYGNSFVVQSIEGLEEGDWNIPGACGYWSVREIIAHLASHEHFLIEVVKSILDKDSPTPILQQFAELQMDYNDYQVALRKDQTPSETWAEYETTFQISAELFSQIPVEKYRQAGLLTWYGQEYDLEDYLVYSFYGHKREHGAQINAFKDILEQQ